MLGPGPCWEVGSCCCSHPPTPTCSKPWLPQQQHPLVPEMKPGAPFKPEDPCPDSWTPWFESSPTAKLRCILGEPSSPLWALVCSSLQ